jgi:hypothetical protein
MAPTAPLIQLLRMAGAFRGARALGVACELEIPDRLAGGARSCEELAAASGSHPEALYRLLRALSGVGVFEELGGRRFALTDRAAVLCGDHPRTLRPSALVFAEDWHWRMWGRLEATLRAGEPAYDVLHGASFHEACASDHGLQTRTCLSRASAYIPSDEAVAEAVDLGDVRRLVEVGAGAGALSARLLARYPALQVVLFDQASAAAVCQPVLGPRARFEAGDYRREVTPGADRYLLRGVIHNFDDAGAVRILDSCRRAMGPRARLLLVEMLMPEGEGQLVGKFIDLESLLLTRGRERGEGELRALVDAAGLVVQRIIPTAAPVSVIECTARGDR